MEGETVGLPDPSFGDAVGHLVGDADGQSVGE